MTPNNVQYRRLVQDLALSAGGLFAVVFVGYILEGHCVVHVTSNHMPSGMIIGGTRSTEKVQQYNFINLFWLASGQAQVNNFIGYAPSLGLIIGGTPSGLYC